jgi:hypothetical protein
MPDDDDRENTDGAPHSVSSVVRKDNGDIHIAITINNNNSNDRGATISGDEIGDEYGGGAPAASAHVHPAAGPGFAPTLDAAVPSPFVRGALDDAFAAAPVYTKGLAPFSADPAATGERPTARLTVGGLVAHGRAALFTPARVHEALAIYQGLCIVEVGAGNAPDTVTLVPGPASPDAVWTHAAHALRTGLVGGHYRLAVAPAREMKGKRGAGEAAFAVTLTPVGDPLGGFLNVIPAKAAAVASLEAYGARAACVPVPASGGPLTVPRPAGAADDDAFFFVVTSTRPDAVSPPLLEVRSNVACVGP